MGPGDLEAILKNLPVESAPGLLSSVHAGEDAGVYLLREDLALIQSVDFFPPVVDDPFLFGQIAAANALSDIYALGGTPLTAMNIVTFPCRMGLDILEQVLLGGHSKVHEAGAVLVGGHTIEDEEPKYGLAVTGTADPGELRSLNGARAGQLLLLTKPLGTGVLTTALKIEMAAGNDIDAACRSMAALNRGASELFKRFAIKTCTDVTGFGLAGHLRDLLVAGGVSAEISASALPLLEGAADLAAAGMLPAGLYRNREYCSGSVIISGNEPPAESDFLYDPQTSGGLLGVVDPGNAGELLEKLVEGPAPGSAIIGTIIAGEPGKMVLLP